MIIYRIYNTITQKSYIGQTISSLEKRWNEHKCDKNRKNNHLSNAIKKYGTECWELKILEIVDDINSLNEREIYWINYHDTYNSGYNSTTGGANGRYLSQETKDKISISKIGKKRKPFSKEWKEKLSKTLATPNAFTKDALRKRSETRKRNYELGLIKAPMSGKKHSEETIQKMKESHTKRKLISN